MNSKNSGDGSPSGLFPFVLRGDFFIDWVVVPASLMVILLAGYSGLFLGQTLFTEGDIAAILDFTMLNERSEGWRPDLGFGSTFFFGDPGVHHTWSVFRWWGHLFSDDILAYNTSIIVLLWVGCIAQYCLLRVAIPDLGRISSVLLSTMLAFGSLRNEFLLGRVSTISPLIYIAISLILYEFLKRPLFRYYFLYTLTLWAALFLGSFNVLLFGLIYSIVFFLILVLYKGLHRNLGELWGLLKRFICLNAVSGVTMVFLGAWVFYSIFLEKFQVGYVRDPDYSWPFFGSYGLRGMMNELFGYLHAGILSHWTGAIWLEQTFRTQPWNMVSPLLPVVLLFSLFYKSQNFWEFASKCIVFGFFIYHWLIFFFPGILGLLHKILNLYPPSRFHLVIQVFEVVLIGILLHRIQAQNWTLSLLGLKVIRVMALLISMLYAGLLVVASLAILRPQALESMLFSAYNWLTQFVQLSANSRGLVPGVITENVQLFNETMGATDVLFYGFTFILIALFVTPYWPNMLKLAKGRVFALLLLVNSLFLAWAIYPLNKETLTWDRQEKNGVKLSTMFEPTDRFAKFGLVACPGSDYIACVKVRYFGGEFGPRRYQVGYERTPALDFSSIKSFTQKDVAAMMDAFMLREGKYREGYRRHMSTFINYFPSKLYDFAAVNYFFSFIRQPKHEQLELVHESQEFYLYRNLNAWPYYYLADRVSLIENYDDLYGAEKGVAYFWKDSGATVFPNKNNGSKGHVELKKFEFGEMVFSTTSKESEILVINDAWHPNWKAEIDQEATPIIKTNGVLKGVVVPPGSHLVRLFFDNTPYRPGIWISLASWIVFISSWSWMARRTKIRGEV